MLSIGLILVFSVVLFVYWFRYSCLLILQTRSPERFRNTGLARGLKYFAVQQVLKDGAYNPGDLDRLNQDLWSDYRHVRAVLQAGAATLDPIERRMLVLDYRFMHLWFVLTRRLAPPQARKALVEMSSVVGYLSDFLRPAAPRGAGA
jgi:hypothetical protein